jgi:hypothetical protein
VRKTILAIDPGPEVSGWAMYDGRSVLGSGVLPNMEVIEQLNDFGSADSLWWAKADLVAIEMIASYGMAVGKDVFETCVWIGRFIQACPMPFERVYRKDVKMHLCGTTKAKDTNIRQALIDKIGPQGVKASPGPTYGVKSHAWPALAVAVTAAESRVAR